MEEIWKSINGHEDYLISNCGRVKTKSRLLRYVHAVTGNEHFRQSTEKYLKEHYTKWKYKFVCLYRDCKPYNKTIHRLVALNFIPNPNGYLVVNHIDGNKHNNRIDNLEWCTDTYNHKHATETGLIAKGEKVGTSKLNEKCVVAIKKLLEQR